MRGLRRGRLPLAVVLIIAAIASGFATYGAMTATPPFGNNPDTVVWLLNLDLIILLLLLSLIANRAVALWSGRRRRLAGSRLHVRLVLIFCFLAATPAIIMTIFSAFFLHFGVQSWFSDRVETAVNESMAVAEAYLEEHQQVIRADILAMANDLDRQAGFIVSKPDALEEIVRTQSILRNFSEAVVFDDRGRILARSGLTFTMAFEGLPPLAKSEAQQGEVAIMTGAGDDRVRALVKLNNYADLYLYVGRMIDHKVLRHLEETREAVQQYAKMEGQRSGLQVTFTMIFVVVALLLLLAAIWIGLMFARQLVLPISALIGAADRIRGGDLTARVSEFEGQDEFTILSRAFNRMTSQIQEQQNELMTANRQLDERRRFTETVLAGVSSGIVGLDDNGCIKLINNAASELFQKEFDELNGRSIVDIMPGLADLLEQAHQKPSKITQGEIPLIRSDESKRTLFVRIAIELIGQEEKGAVLTFDDITELQSAQRKAAWADVARRIAHEIKNPLTPIQLSAERLKRKYLSQITDNPEVFSQCTDTIVHHVEDIGRMVDEFSAFARMPEPSMKEENIARHIREIAVFQQQAHADIKFEYKGLLNEKVLAYVDSNQIRQAVTNIIQNAVEAIEAKIRTEEEEGQETEPGSIHISLIERKDHDELAIVITDNGPGLPKGEDPNRLMEPYITHRERGTGLGLAIVRKIMEDHKGQLVMGAPDWLEESADWQDLGGATIVLVVGHVEGEGI